MHWVVESPLHHFLVQCSQNHGSNIQRPREESTARLSYSSFNIGGRRENLTICIFFIFLWSLGETLKWYNTSNAWTCIFKSRPEIAMYVESFPSVLEISFVFERALRLLKKKNLTVERLLEWCMTKNINPSGALPNKLN